MNGAARSIGNWGRKRILIILLGLWLVVLIFTAVPMFNNISNTQSDSRTAERLQQALVELEALQRQNNELEELFKDINVGDLQADEKEVIENFRQRLTKVDYNSFNQDFTYIAPKEEPNAQYEVYRRRVRTNIQEFWSYIKTELTNLQQQANYQAPDLVAPIKNVLDLGRQHRDSLLHDMKVLSDVDGYATWREKESNALSNLVQTRFAYLQNPADCESAKKLVCNLNKGCGYGCQLHHAVYCFMVAYGTQRTLILKSKGWRYHKGGWEEIFLPISNTCTDDSGESKHSWPGKPDTQVLTLPIIDSINPRPPYLPLSIPEDLAPRLIRLHGDPIVWWVGQILKYLLRPQERTTTFLQTAITNMGFKRPIVGVHVRRTDKVGTEAQFHGIDEYMAAVDEYYNQLEFSKEPVDKRRIYLASDDPKVIADAKVKYPHYEILGDADVAKTAAVSSRYSESSLHGIILDIHMLSMCDYLVCTFSSQVCRVAYEIMQNYFPDAADKFKSLDDIYYYGGQNGHNRMAVLAHEPAKSGEIELKVGDKVGVAGNHWNGYSKGKNLRTQQSGLYPSFKVKDIVEIRKFPTYPEATEQQH